MAAASTKRWWLVAVPLVVVFMVLIILVLLRVVIGPEQRSAMADASTLGDAVASHVEQYGVLPRVTVAPDGPAEDPVWGPDFVVESQRLPRATPDAAVGYFLVGTPQRWCVDVSYNPQVSSESAATRWVSVRGTDGDAGRVRSGRCGPGYDLYLQPLTGPGPTSDSVVPAASAAPGICVRHPFMGPDDVESTGEFQVVDCADAHFGEVFHGGELEDDSYATARGSAGQSCAEAFPDFVGVSDQFSALTHEAFLVDEAAWARGQRAYSCLLWLGSEDYPLVGTARDSWR